MAAAFLMRDGDDSIDSVSVGAYIPQSLGYSHRDMTGTVRRGDDGNVIARAHVAVFARVAHERSGLFGRKIFGHGRARGVLVIPAAEIGRDVVRMRPLAGRDLPGRPADGLAVFRDRTVRRNRLQRDLVTRRDVFARGHLVTVGDDYRPRHYGQARDGDVVFLVE